MSNGIKFFEGLAVGGILGFFCGLLSAPKPGNELRKELLSESEDLYRQATESVADMKAKTNQAIAALQARGEDLVKVASESFAANAANKENAGDHSPPHLN